MWELSAAVLKQDITGSADRKGAISMLKSMPSFEQLTYVEYKNIHVMGLE